MIEIYHWKYPPAHQPEEPISNISVFFPGQDVRETGMFDKVMEYPAGEEVIDYGSRLLQDRFGYDIKAIAAKGADSEFLKRNEFTQAAVFLWAVAEHNIHKYRDHRVGYATRPRYLSGNSMGMVTAATMSGALTFEEGVYLIGKRGIITQEFSDPTPSSMAAIIGPDRAVIDEVLKRHPGIDLCLINAEKIHVVGGPDNGHENDPQPTVIREFESMGFRVSPVNTERAMHGRGVRPARGEFVKTLYEVNFKDPLIPLIGTYKINPITTAEELREDLAYGFDNTYDNDAILRYLHDMAKVHIMSEVNEKGTFTNMAVRSLNVISTRGKLAAKVLAVLGVAAAVTWGVHEAITHHHPDYKKVNGEKP